MQAVGEPADRGRKKASRVAEDLYALAARCANVGVWDFDPRSDRVEFSQQFWTMLGYTPGDITARGLKGASFDKAFGHVHPEDRQPTLERFHRHLEQGVERYEAALRMRHKDGSWRWMLSRAQAIRDDREQVTRVVGTHVDIDRLMRLEADLRRAKKEADRANRIKSDFLAAASYDLQQPLQSLNLVQEVLAKKVKDKDLLRIVANLGATIGNMTETLNTLLDIDQLETGIVEPHFVEFAIGDFLGRLRDEYVHQAHAKGLEFRAVPTTARIRTDPQLLTRAIQNLVANAIKYTIAGKILLGCRRHGAGLRIEIWDSGIGIPSDQLHAIFDSNHPAHSATRRQKRGLGLGLSVAGHVTTLLGHGFDVRSVVGEGSVFTIIAPLVEVPGPPRAPPPTTESARQEAPSILLIEDDETLLDALATLLVLEGFKVASVSSHEQALARLNDGTAKPDIIVADSSLGEDLTGIKVVNKLRQEAGRDIPSIVISGLADRAAVRYITEAGMHSLQKPVKSQQLITLITKLLAGGDQATAEAKRGPPPESAHIPWEMPAPGERSDPVVHLVDEEEATRTTWRRILEGEGMTVRTFESAEAFLEAYDPRLRGCLVTDFALPGMNGLELQNRLRDAGVFLPVIVSTGLRELRIAAHAVLAGATDVLEKPVSGDRLVNAVRYALKAEEEQARADTEKANREAQYGRLTSREKQVMALIVEGWANKEVAYRLKISQRTVEGHRSQIMQKLRIRTFADLVRMAGTLGVDPCAPCAPAPPGEKS